jgi:hypothetical protein
MRIRVFADENRGPVKAALNFLAKEGGGGNWTIEWCDPHRWTPPPANATADIHLYIDVPVRLAVPWTGYNALSVLGDLPFEWEWCDKEMGARVDRDSLEETRSAVTALRALIKKAQAAGGKPALPIAPAYGSVPPKIGVITVTKNRPEWFFNMAQNVTQQQWPTSRLEWIIVDDSPVEKQLHGHIATLQAKAPALNIKYVVVEPDVEMTIGGKRNEAVKAADADTTVFCCMDDDDHYPASSLALRASWLTRPGTEIVYCSMLPMYDARRYISAMSVPPLADEPTKRVSEASLCFTRDAWNSAPFPEISMAEGEFFLWGRVEKSVEVPPAGIIVSFIHGGNTSSRRVPASQEPNGCHYGFSDEYFRWLSELCVACPPTADAELCVEGSVPTDSMEAVD